MNRFINTTSIFYQVIIFFILILSGCLTLKLTYDFADTLILWELDNYFDLESKQEDILLPVIQNNLKRHRNQELPQYAELIRYIQKSGKDGLEPKEIEVILQTVWNII